MVHACDVGDCWAVSIDKEQTVEIDEEVTVLVGMNEAGKTVFLKSLMTAPTALAYPRSESGKGS